MKRFRSIALILLILICLGCLSPLASADNPVQNASKSVVRVAVLLCDGDTPLFDVFCFGTGICIGKSGGEVHAVVTNRHVVDPEELYNNLPAGYLQRFGSSVKAKVFILADNAYYPVDYDNVAVSKTADLALVYSDTAIRNRQPAVLKNADYVSIADTVYAIGYPGFNDLTNRTVLPGTSAEAAFASCLPSRLDDLCVTQGTVSRMHIRSGGEDYIQHEASINHGNSGGPLVSEDGCVVGVNTSIRVEVENAYKIQYSISGDTLLAFLDQNHAEYATDSSSVRSDRESAPRDVSVGGDSAGASERSASVPFAWILAACVLVFLIVRFSRKRPAPASASSAPAAAPSVSAAGSSDRPAYPPSPEPSAKSPRPSPAPSVAPGFSAAADFAPRRPEPPAHAGYSPNPETKPAAPPAVSYHMGTKPASASKPKISMSGSFSTPTEFDDAVSSSPLEAERASASPASSPKSSRSFTVSASFGKKD